MLSIKPEPAPHNEWQCPTCRLAARAREGMLATPNNPLIVAAVQAICAGGVNAALNDGGWRQDRSGEPYFDFWSGSGARIRVWIDEPDHAQGWREIQSYSALTLDTAAALLAGLGADVFRSITSAPRRDSVRLSAAAVLNAKQYRRFGAERVQFAGAVEAEIAKLLRLRFDIINYPAYNPVSRGWSRTGVTRRDIALFERTPEQGPRDPNDCARGAPLRFGAWAEHWLTTAGPIWVSPLPQAILAFDHRDNRGADVLAKKIALLFALNWGAARNNPRIELEMRALLRRIGELRRPGAEAAHHSGRLADRVEEAILRLSECGLFQIKVAGDSAAALRAAGRRWFDEWLAARVTVAQPRFIAASLRKAPDGLEVLLTS